MATNIFNRQIQQEFYPNISCNELPHNNFSLVIKNRSIHFRYSNQNLLVLKLQLQSATLNGLVQSENSVLLSHFFVRLKDFHRQVLGQIKEETNNLYFIGLTHVLGLNPYPNIRQKINCILIRFEKYVNKIKCFIEPVGAKAPALQSNDVRRSWIERVSNHTLALFCKAQAFPVPVFR